MPWDMNTPFLKRAVEGISNMENDKSLEKPFVPIWEKYALTIYEAAEYFGIGEHRLRAIVHENRYADFILWIGVKAEIKRKLFEDYLDNTNAL